MRPHWSVWLGASFVALVACVGDEPAGSSGGGNSSGAPGSSASGGTTSGGGASSGGASSGDVASSSSSGAPDASTCGGVLCEDFESEPAFAAWTIGVDNGRVLPVDGYSSLKALGVQLLPVDAASENFFKAAITRTTPLPAARFVRLDLRFWVSACDHSLLEIARVGIGRQPLDLQWHATGPKVRYYADVDGGDAAELLEYPVMAPSTWTPFWIEVDRTTGAVSAAVNGVERPALRRIGLPADAAEASEPTLQLGAAATKSGCEVRIDDVKISVR